MLKKGLPWPLPIHSMAILHDPFEAFSKCRVTSKTTFSLDEREEWDMPEPIEEEDMEEEDPFDLWAPGI